MNPFVPKPGTPYQWLPMEDPREADRKLQYLRKAFARIPNVDAVIKSARTGAVQSVLALGDRRVADALEVAATQGTSPWVVGDGGATLSVDDAGGSLTIDGTVAVSSVAGTVTSL